ncbi:hypothetical protein CFC21_061154 [Triticum aestivum]|uniref:Non-specific lipid-transfer protein n=4 Tax=Triticinae TaxID=1648030 RepID=A0A453HPJ3_AEGTS|nr:non-specific lipid-transfer protein 1-like [Aegilops tauschii subsp. strangulata]XP_044377775.1 non-specific lipid-transfer protein 1-like [Triticum aestivum]KAF7053175.1 hypothetical protein CFC21_061154 [Triticum aestivum]
MARAAAANIVVVAVVAAMLLAAAHTADAAISCGQVNSALGPCLTYARGGAGPSAVCCSGVKRLAAATQTTVDRRAACNCLKMAIGRMSGFKAGNIASIPSKCGVSVPYAVGASVDCSRVS